VLAVTLQLQRASQHYLPMVAIPTAVAWARARAAPAAEFRAQGTAAEHLSDPEHRHLLCRAGWQRGRKQAPVAKPS